MRRKVLGITPSGGEGGGMALGSVKSGVFGLEHVQSRDW